MIKYRAVVTVNRRNYRVSPWFTHVREVEDWTKENQVQYDAILPAANWREIVDYEIDGATGAREREERTMSTFVVTSEDLVCSGCGKTSLLAHEILAIKATGLCFDCVPECGLVDELTAKITGFAPTVPEPSLEQLMEWETEGYCEATDGCIVEPDGTCVHSHVSWLVYLGYI